MNFLKLGILGMYYPKQIKNLAIRAQVMYTPDGLNVGQSIGFTGGLLYTFHFAKKENQ
jgi:hypothetical protein